MIYQSNDEAWPVDRSGGTIFFLEAIKRLCVELHPTWTGPRSLWPFNDRVPDQRDATIANRARAVEFLSWHDPDVSVDHISLPQNDSIPSGIPQDSLDFDLTADHWSKVRKLEAQILSQTPQDVSAIVDALERFAGGAAKSDGVRTSLRCVQTNGVEDLCPIAWNVSRQVLAARYALGRMDRTKFNAVDPWGTHHIFVEVLSFRTWLGTLSGMSKLVRAELYVDSLAKDHPTGRPPGEKRAVIGHLTDVIGLRMSEAEDTWRRKAPKHWKISGAPRAPSGR